MKVDLAQLFWLLQHFLHLRDLGWAFFLVFFSLSDLFSSALKSLLCPWCL